MASRGRGTQAGQIGASILAFPPKSEFAGKVQLDSQVALSGHPVFSVTAPGKSTTGNADKHRSVSGPESSLNRWLRALGFSPSEVSAVDRNVGMVVSATPQGTTRKNALSALAQKVTTSANALRS